eukprot:16432505-Heterocapsa_arctica.AAC.1
MALSWRALPRELPSMAGRRARPSRPESTLEQNIAAPHRGTRQQSKGKCTDRPIPDAAHPGNWVRMFMVCRHGRHNESIARKQKRRSTCITVLPQNMK